MEEHEDVMVNQESAEIPAFLVALFGAAAVGLVAWASSNPDNGTDAEEIPTYPSEGLPWTRAHRTSHFHDHIMWEDGNYTSENHDPFNVLMLPNVGLGDGDSLEDMINEWREDPVNDNFDEHVGQKIYGLAFSGTTWAQLNQGLNLLQSFTDDAGDGILTDDQARAVREEWLEGTGLRSEGVPDSN